MIVIDANLLIYAYDTKSPFHESARSWLEEAFSSEEEIGLPYQSIFAFLRVLTHPRLSTPPIPLQTGLDIVGSWLRAPGVWLLTPGVGHWVTFSRLCVSAGATGNLITDSHIAAIAIEAQATLFSADQDFARFAELKWTNPLAQTQKKASQEEQK